jgi:hypothetical protein
MTTSYANVGGHIITLPPFTTSKNLGQLPLVSFPNDCISSLWDMQTTGLGLPWTYETAGCAVSTCCPSSNFYTEPWAWYTSYYSPGVCPSQYTACSAPFSFLTATLAKDESIALCCPTSQFLKMSQLHYC